MMSVNAENNGFMVNNLCLNEGNFSIGRAGDNDLHIKDTTVSSHHARIYTYLDASYIEDLNSTNGTFLNGKRIIKHTLRVGDLIKIGNKELTFTKKEL